MIRVEDWNKYMKLKTFHENLKDGTMLNMDFFKTKEPLDARHIVISMSEYNVLNKDHEVLERLYDAGVDNWVGYDDALNGDEKMED